LYNLKIPPQTITIHSHFSDDLKDLRQKLAQKKAAGAGKPDKKKAAQAAAEESDDDE